MKKFSELGVNLTNQKFVGDKIKVRELLDKPIVVERYRIEDSKKIVGDKCLHIQISINEVKHVIFTSGKALMDVLQQANPADFPFETIIKEVNKQYLFS